MTTADRPAFRQRFNAMCVAFREPTDDPIRLKGQLDVYFRALADLPLSAVVSGALTLERSRVDPSGEWSRFPTSPQWHQAAEEAFQAERRAFLLPAVEQIRGRLAAPFCELCDDTGFTLATAPDVVEPQKVKRCDCRATNPKFKALQPPPEPPDPNEAAQLTDQVRGRRGLEKVGR